MNIIIYYINLKKRSDRNDILLKELEYLKELDYIKDINIQRIDAVDKDDLDREKLIEDKYINDKTTLRMGQIACILSHKKTWKEFIKSKYDYCIILEDDVKINKEYFKESFYKILNDLNNIKFDWLYLGRNNLCIPNFYRGKKIRDNFYLPISTGYGAHSYILSKQGANKKIKYYEYIKGNTILTNHPLDLMYENIHLMNHYMNIKFKCLSILPFGGLDKYKDKKYSESQEFMFHQRNITDTDTS